MKHGGGGTCPWYPPGSYAYGYSSLHYMIANSTNAILSITGLKFWKSHRRKVYAVPISDRKKRKRKHQNEVVSIDSDSDELTPK